MKPVAVVGGGVAGVTAAWELARRGVPFVLFEAGARLGGIVETVRTDGFIVDLGPDGWVTEKPWARTLAADLGLKDELIESNDATRVTYILHRGRLEAMPDGMRMMVPTDLAALAASPLFSIEAQRAYAAEPGRAAELRAAAPDADESIASFVARHFGLEVLDKVGAPLLSGVFGGDVHTLSVRAVMPAYVGMEREHGSLIQALIQATAPRFGVPQASVFTSLRTGVGTLLEKMVAELPAGSVRLGCAVDSVERCAGGWAVQGERYGAVFVATPAAVTARLFPAFQPYLPLEASSAVVVALAFAERFPLPPGFGFLVPAGEDNTLLAVTFADQKYAGRVPAGGRLVRAFFGAGNAQAISLKDDAEIAALALRELRKVLGSLPEPAWTLVRRWPGSLPQYAVGHLERIAALDRLVAGLPGLFLLGNSYRGVGVPDLIRDARAAARTV